MNCGEHLPTIYGDQRAVDDLSFDVRPGRLLRLVIGAAQSITTTAWLRLRLLTRAHRDSDDMTGEPRGDGRGTSIPPDVPHATMREDVTAL